MQRHISTRQDLNKKFRWSISYWAQGEEAGPTAEARR